MTDDEVVDQAENLARQLYNITGNRVSENYKLRNATHPQEIMCWNMACLAFKELRNTDPEDAVANLEE